MSTPTLETRPDGGIVVEADTTEQALTEVGRRLGPDAEIVSARKVHRGGWNGFFARELVQLEARARDTSPSAAPGPPPPATSDDGLAGALARLTREADDRELSFRDVLVRELGVERAAETDDAACDAAAPIADAPPVEAAAVEAAAVEAAAVEAAAVEVPPAAVRSTVGGAAWSIDLLQQLRLPPTVVEACRGLDPSDDAAWLLAVAGAVGSWCRPLPARDAVLIGPRAHRLGDGLGLPSARPGGAVPPTGTVALKVTDTPEGRAWVDRTRAGRWGHLVVGGARWQAFLFDDVTAVSWVDDEHLPAALEAAARMGLVLGYGLGDATGRRPVRATPLDVALTVRSLLPRHV
jgi:hypothetical protein